jgi:hypothetical protein
MTEVEGHRFLYAQWAIWQPVVSLISVTSTTSVLATVS